MAFPAIRIIARHIVLCVVARDKHHRAQLDVLCAQRTQLVDGVFQRRPALDRSDDDIGMALQPKCRLHRGIDHVCEMRRAVPHEQKRVRIIRLESRQNLSQLKQVIVIRNQRFTDAATQESPRIAHIRCADFFVVFVAAEQVRRLNKHRVIAFVRQFFQCFLKRRHNFAARFQHLADNAARIRAENVIALRSLRQCALHRVDAPPCPFIRRAKTRNDQRFFHRLSSFGRSIITTSIPRSSAGRTLSATPPGCPESFDTIVRMRS